MGTLPPEIHAPPDLGTAGSFGWRPIAACPRGSLTRMRVGEAHVALPRGRKYCRPLELVRLFAPVPGCPTQTATSKSPTLASIREAAHSPISAPVVDV
jgi:hypothetical protein